MTINSLLGKPVLVENPTDGSARVVKESDWKGVAPNSMRGFSLAPFSVPGRSAALNPQGDEAKMVELRKAMVRGEETQKKAIALVRQEMSEKVHQAMTEGMEKGRIEGEKTAQTKYSQQLDQLRKQTELGLKRIDEQKAKVFFEFEKQAIDLLSGALHRLLGGQADWQTDIVLPMLREAVTALGQASSLTVRIHPEDAQIVQENKSIWLTLDMSGGEIRFIEDDRVPHGGCHVEAGSTSAAADPASIAERMVDAVKQVHLARLEAHRNDVAKET